MKLFFREQGAGDPIIILHGLLGSSDNWLTQAKLLAPDYRVFFLDQRNHGQSPQSPEHSYRVMMEDLLEFIKDQNLNNPVIIGHSMGGKTAMNLALKYPERLKALIVVDIAPRAYALHHDHIMEGLMAIPVATLTSRNEADRILAGYVPEPDVRQFLLKNLARKAEGGFTWKANVAVLNQTLPQIVDNIELHSTFDKPTLFIRGRKSDYVQDADWPQIQKHFPQAKLVTMETGHWIQAEKPQEFVDEVKKFLHEQG
jgi:pimeloyl-ACP methyl ester carboxylesterase